MNIVFPESGMQLESNHDDEANENFQKKKHWSYVYHTFRYIENTSWKVLAYGIYARVVDVSEIERVSAANE